MLNLKKYILLLILFFPLLTFVFSGKAISSDLDIFDVVMDDVQPNVLIILDISLSMNDVDAEDENDVVGARLAVAKKAITGIIEQNDNVRWGFMVFTYSFSTSTVMGSGQLVEECRSRNDIEHRRLLNTINAVKANGGTPVAATLAEAGLYFAGKRSFFWAGSNIPSVTPRTYATQNGLQYKSPIENECQNNYIILVADGFSSVNSGILGRSYYNTDNNLKYNFATRNDIIYFQDYINGVKIDGNKDTKGQGSYGYITWKTFHAPEDQREDLGIQLASYTYDFWWTAAENDRIKGNLYTYDHAFYSIFLDWPKTEAATVDASYTNTIFGVGNRLTAFQVNQMILRKLPYKYGYNAGDPSRPIPNLPVFYNKYHNYRNNPSGLFLYNQGYIAGTQIYNGNIWDSGLFARDYLDDVAAILFHEDLRPDMGIGTKYEKQNVKTFTVGFKFSGDLLERTAIMGGTDKKGYMTADNYKELEASLSQIIRSIKEEVSVFASPAMPASGENELYTGKHLYMGQFKPSEGYWVGNLKRYTLDDDNTMAPYLDANGAIKASARSDWSGKDDGNDVAMGGAAEALNAVLANMAKATGSTRDLRRIYTYIDGNTTELADDSNLFLENNARLLDNGGALLGFDANTEAAEINDAITRARLTPIGAIMHSTPILIRHGNNKVIYVGANDGFLHAFQDHDSHVSEAWAFIMPEHLKTITLARDESPNDGRYYVDGSMAYRTLGREIILIAGARHGGDNYVALNVADFNNPGFKYEVSQAGVGWAIGQSWGIPRFIDGGKYVLLPGGYDLAYDTDSPSSGKGAGVIGLDAASGSPAARFKSLHGGIMQHSVLDLSVFDVNSDSVIDTIYYGDLGGHMFYASTIDPEATGSEPAGTAFTPYILFKTDKDGGRKFMYAPDMVLEAGLQYIYFGSGDRESPLSKDVQDRFFCLKNDGKTHLEASALGSGYLTDDNLYNATANEAQHNDESVRTQARADMDAADGWFFDLGKGEKVVGSPVVYKGLVVFTTYQPDEKADEPDPADPCKSGGASGTARMYIVNYLYATGAISEDSDERSQIIGNTIPSAPVLSIFEVEGGINVKITVTVGLKDIGGNQSIGVIQRDLGTYGDEEAPASTLKVFYWREFF